MQYVFGICCILAGLILAVIAAAIWSDVWVPYTSPTERIVGAVLAFIASVAVVFNIGLGIWVLRGGMAW